MKYWEYVGIYRTTVLEGQPQKIVIDNTKIELLPTLPREWKIHRVRQRVVAAHRNSTLAEAETLRLTPPERLIVITCRTAESDPTIARDVVDRQLQRAITVLSLSLGRAVFERVVYRGWVESRRGLMLETTIRQVQPILLPRSDLEGQVSRVYHRLHAEKEERFDLMARLFFRGIALEASEEQFVLFWTILEVFPMMNTSNIQSIADFLGRELKLPPALIKTRLDLGRLYGRRCSLVHDGTLGVDRHELNRLISKLEAICMEVMRLFSGLGYTGSLGKYLEDHAGSSSDKRQ